MAKILRPIKKVSLADKVTTYPLNPKTESVKVTRIPKYLIAARKNGHSSIDNERVLKHILSGKIN